MCVLVFVCPRRLGHLISKYPAPSRHRHSLYVIQVIKQNHICGAHHIYAMMGLRCRHVFGQNSIRHTSGRGSQCSQCFQAAPRSTTLQDICESVCEKWLGLGVVMPSGHTIAPGKPFATAGDILLDLPTHPVRPEKLIPGSPNSHAVWALVPPPETSPLWQLSGDLQGTRISGGTFRLPDNAFLVLTDCSGISFQDVQFIGAKCL